MNLLTLFNIIVTTPFSIWTYSMWVQPLFNLPTTSTDLQSFWYIFPMLFIFAVLYDFLFGVMHWFAHRPILFRYVHYIHHKCIHPSGLDAFNTHPLEHIFVNVWPLLLSASVVAYHMVHLIIIGIVAIITTMYAHSSFEGHEHTFHHEKGHSNYGSWPYIFDRLIGTYRVKLRK